MPYPNEYAARIRDPGSFLPDTFRRKELTDGVTAILGKLKSDGADGSMIIQAYRFDKSKFSPAEARKWLEDHDIKVIEFVPAEETKDIDPPIDILELDDLNTQALLAELYAIEIAKGLKAGRVIAGRNIERLRRMNDLMRQVHAVMVELEADGTFALEEPAPMLTDMNASIEDGGKAVWTTEALNDLPDSCFLYVEPGDKDEEGKTTPRLKRHFPYKDSEGAVDLAHLRNAIARIPQSNAPGLTPEKKTALQEKARAILEKEANKSIELSNPVVTATDGTGVAITATISNGPITLASQWEEAATTLVAPGGEIKALGGGKVGGYLVRFSDAAQADLVGDFFTKATDFDVEPGERTRIYYQHGLDPKIKRRILGQGALKVDDLGIWIEGQLRIRDAYEKWVYSQIEAGKMGWSSGVPSHLVEREPEGKAFRVLSWPLGKDASITPTPCEPRNAVMPLKSVSIIPTVFPPDSDTDAGHTQPNNQTHPIEEDNKMADIDYKVLAAELAPLLREALKPDPPKPDATPPVKMTEFAVPKQEESEFKNFGQFLQAVYGVAVPNGVYDKRLIKAATGLGEGVPSDGGFLVQQDTSDELLKRTYETGILIPRCRRIPISANSNGIKINAIQETTRASSRWGGVIAYWQDEAATKAATKPAFRQMELNLKKLTALCYATDELLQDATALEATIMSAFPEEINFQMDDAIINGTGAGQPLGILLSPCLVSVAKETGQAAATIVAENIFNMWTRLWGRSRANAIWLINQDIEQQLYKMFIAAGTGGVPVYLPAGGLSAQPYSTLMGRPVIPCEQCATLGTQGDIILADLSQYLLIDKGGINSQSSIHVRFIYDETTFRFVYRADGQPTWNSALTPYKGSNTQSPFVVLDSRA